MLQLIIKDFFCLTELSISVFKRALMTSHNPTPLISRDETRHKSPLYWKLDKLQAIQTERVTTNWNGNIIKKEIPHPLTCKTVCHSSPKVTQVRQLGPSKVYPCPLNRLNCQNCSLVSYTGGVCLTVLTRLRDVVPCLEHFEQHTVHMTISSA